MTELKCPWCEMQCGSSEGLMCHLQASHDRFSYAMEAGSSIPEIYVSLKPQADMVSGISTFTYCSQRRGGAPLSEAIANLAEVADEGSKEELGSEFAEGKKKRKAFESGTEVAAIRPKGKQKRPAGPKVAKGGIFQDRQYFRSQTCLPIDATDMDYDSDDDVDDEWQLQQAERLMDEFEDVTHREKAFMKLWNRFVHRHAILADFHVAQACEAFATHYTEQLISGGLRDELLFHLFALWDFNLVDKEHIVKCMAIVDQANQESGKASSEASGSKKQVEGTSGSKKQQHSAQAKD
eukprot:CAMPEP_0184325068 /NCGR_PEP_ID=MMETSP1049-20130417/138443_1 /TAXON_ID=77928 /ORGANISM="Proteomonas sulcata, Strain CCMP704" /LENGTH=293 /DNA_ID=CAMNT_0026647023 /DNA_START=98 /DNA_END=979 /DNA_ORIENTATION=+